MEEPDFIGSWSMNPSLRPIGYGNFKMYIKERKSIKEGVELIKGTIEDCFGNAVFDGELSPEHIKFTKKYFSESVLNGAAPGKIKYEGKKIGDKYFGEYTVINVTTKGAPLDLDFQPEGMWKSNFVLEQYFDYTMN